MNTLIFATNNEHKVKEIKSLLRDGFSIKSLAESGINIEIPEPFNTLEANAIQKARTIYELTGNECFSEDTGLEVDALGGEPGVKSARYAGEARSFERNINKLLSDMKSVKNRKARFRTVICLIQDGRHLLFEGICPGSITYQKIGSKGFGYDSVFIPEGSEKTFALMDIPEKNKFSHRKKAIEKLIQHLERDR
jgi:XTP/dITP diphosphohydrolase